MRAPRQPEPAWYELCADGDYQLLDEALKVPAQSKDIAEWIRLVIAYAKRRGVDLHSKKCFDSTPGYPGEGPSKAARDPTLLLPGVTFQRLWPSV